MALKELSDGGPDGTRLGKSASDLISLYGKTPIAQRSSTVLATSLLSASSYVSVASNTAAILTEISNALVNFGVIRTTA
jgi:hypothetical protein